MDAYHTDMSAAQSYKESFCYNLNTSAQFAKYSNINPKTLEIANDDYLESNNRVVHAYDCLKIASRFKQAASGLIGLITAQNRFIIIGGAAR